MSQEQHDTNNPDQTDVPSGDDEAENREHIEQTGETKQDRLGNADGAS